MEPSELEGLLLALEQEKKAVVSELNTVAKPVKTVKEAMAEAKPPVEPAKAPPAFTMKSFVDPEELQQDLRMNLVELDEALMTHASKYAYYAIQHAGARRQADQLKSKLKLLDAKLDAEKRSALISDGKKVTEAQVGAAILEDPRRARLHQMCIDADHIAAIAEASVYAMVQRKDLLLEVARDRRKEREGEIRVMGEQDTRERLNGMVKEYMQSKQAA